MTWFASSTNETEAAKENYHLFVAVDLDFPSGHVRFWSGIGELTIGGNVFTGSGEMGKISVPEERAGLDAPRKTYSLSGVDPALIAESDLDGCFGRSVVEYFGFLNSETRQLIDTPEINWEGRIDNARRVDGDEPVIEINAEHRFVLLDQSDGWRYTHEHHQLFYAGDNGFNLVKTLQTKNIIWGSQRSTIGVIRNTVQDAYNRARGG